MDTEFVDTRSVIYNNNPALNDTITNVNTKYGFAFEKNFPNQHNKQQFNNNTNSTCIGTLHTFVLVIFEYFFIFLVGFFAGSACTLVVAIYLVGITYNKCSSPDKKGTAKQTFDVNECIGWFFIFIISICGSTFLYLMFIAVRSYIRNRTKKIYDYDDDFLTTDNDEFN